MALVLGPRSFVGNQAAPVQEYWACYARSISNGETLPALAAAFDELCSRLVSDCRAPDLGLMATVQLDKMMTLFDEIDGLDEAMVLATEHILKIEFPIPKPVGCALATRHPRKSPVTVPLYSRKAKCGLGARLYLDGSLENIKITREMFPLVTTSDPITLCITEPELTYVKDVLWMYTVEMHGEAYVDEYFRNHIGQQADLLFPNRPAYGTKEGIDRHFSDMLKSPRHSTTHVHERARAHTHLPCLL